MPIPDSKQTEWSLSAVLPEDCVENAVCRGETVCERDLSKTEWTRVQFENCRFVNCDFPTFPFTAVPLPHARSPAAR